MGSLTEAYDRPVSGGGGQDDSDHTTRERPAGPDIGGRPRPYLGVGVLTVGSLLIIAGVVLATSETAAGNLGLVAVQANEVARACTGLALPLVFVGVLAVLPIAGRVLPIAAGGLVFSVVGLGAFLWAYPNRWLGDPLDLTVPVAVLYALGLLVTFLSLTAGVLAVDREHTSDSDPDRSRGRNRGAPSPNDRTSLR
jgi:hypothetical protein